MQQSRSNQGQAADARRDSHGYDGPLPDGQTVLALARGSLLALPDDNMQDYSARPGMVCCSGGKDIRLCHRYSIDFCW